MAEQIPSRLNGNRRRLSFLYSNIKADIFYISNSVVDIHHYLYVRYDTLGPVPAGLDGIVGP